MSTAGTPMDEGTMPSERDERRRGDYRRGYDERVDKESAQVVAGGSSIEVITGAGAAVLGVLGLVDILPSLFLTICCMAIGAGLLFAGGSIASKYRDLISGTGDRRDRTNMAETGGGVTAETLGGIAGLVLGLLALIGLEPGILTSVAIIVLGGATMFGAGATRRLSNVMIETSGAPLYKQRVANESVKGAAAAQTFLGLAAVLLGVLALIDIGPPLTLKLAASVILGAGLLLSGLAVGGKMINTLYRARHDDDHRSDYRHGRDRDEYSDRRGEHYGGSESRRAE